MTEKKQIKINFQEKRFDVSSNSLPLTGVTEVEDDRDCNRLWRKVSKVTAEPSITTSFFCAKSPAKSKLLSPAIFSFLDSSCSCKKI